MIRTFAGQQNDLTVHAYQAYMIGARTSGHKRALGTGSDTSVKNHTIQYTNGKHIMFARDTAPRGTHRLSSTTGSDLPPEMRCIAQKVRGL
jgi:hypothetical protein